MNVIRANFENLYWRSGAKHDTRTADFYYYGKREIEHVENTLMECIELLKVSGKNTKELVRQKLTELIGGNL